MTIVAASSLLAATSTSLYTSVGNSAVVLVSFCNTNLSAAVTVNVWMVPSGRSADSTTLVLNTIQIQAGDTFQFNGEKFLLSNGDQVYAQASSASQVAVLLSYITI